MANNEKRGLDALREKISLLPLKVVVQSKLLSKDVRDMISHDAEFAQLLFNRHKDSSTQLIYTVFDGAERKRFFKISLNPITQSESSLPEVIEILASYRYKLVTVHKLEENSNLFYKFHLLSSEQPDVWREIQVRTISFLSSLVCGPHVYWGDSLYWLRKDGSVLAFDTKREEATLIDRPEFLDLDYGKILTGQDKWLGIAQGLLTLVCIFRTRIDIATFDSANKSWNISRTLDNFVLDQEGSFKGCPVWIDSKQVSFLVQNPQTWHYDLYEYDTNTNVYENVAVLPIINTRMHCFHPTLASVHSTPYNDATDNQQAHIAANLNDINRFIIEGIPAVVVEEDENEYEYEYEYENEDEEEGGADEAAGGEEDEEAGGEED
uniref:F-box protein interaction domain containing protein n=1 Tax=Solanum demissum TaxID=50514 RepID=Q60D08_SOLDE|nr:hypothetical protein SDM1_56t00015 [Solanum demissum]